MAPVEIVNNVLAPQNQPVEPLGEPSVSRQIAVSATSVNTAMTPTCRRLSMRTTIDVFYRIGRTSQTAVLTDHLLAAGERIDISTMPNCNIAFRTASGTGTVYISELQ